MAGDGPRRKARKFMGDGASEEALRTDRDLQECFRAAFSDFTRQCTSRGLPEPFLQAFAIVPLEGGQGVYVHRQSGAPNPEGARLLWMAFAKVDEMAAGRSMREILDELIRAALEELAPQQQPGRADDDG